MNHTKTELRQAMRRKRQQQNAEVAQEKSAAIASRIFAIVEFRRATRVALYWPIAGQGEVETWAVDRELRSRGSHVFYPVLPSDPAQAPGFVRVQEPGDMQLRGRAFPEPSGAADASALTAIELVVVPAIAATTAGQRIGFGSGFYDRILPRLSPSTMSLVAAYQFQIVPSLSVETHDYQCDVVVTESATYR